MPTNFKEDFDFLEPQDLALLQRLYKSHRKLLDLFYKIKDHYMSIRESKIRSKALSGSIPELLEVLYARLEEADFAKQDESTMLFWKYLAEEYAKRYRKN